MPCHATRILRGHRCRFLAYKNARPASCWTKMASSLRGAVLWAVLASTLLVGLQESSARNEGFVRTAGTFFTVDGKPMFVNGFNSYWLLPVAAEPSQRYKVSDVFQQARAHGLNVARTWAFNDGQYKALQLSPGVYDEQVFQALDFVVSEARKNHIRLILSLVNNYQSFGGKSQYVQWARNAGQYLSSENDFFTNPTVKGYFKNHIQRVLTRVNTITGIAYKDDPTIFAWELMNEPRCQSDPSGRSIQSWLQEMASHVKSIDGNHLLEAGLEGFYGEYKKDVNPGFSVGTDFVANNQIREFDFATVHSYPDIWLKDADEGTQMAFLQRWLATHVDDATHLLRKPLLFAEFGKSSRDPGFSIAERDNLMSTVYSQMYASAKKGGAAAGSLFWQLMTEGMSNYDDGYEVVFSEQPSTAELISSQSHKLNELTQVLQRLFQTERDAKRQAHHRRNRRPDSD